MQQALDPIEVPDKETLRCLRKLRSGEISPDILKELRRIGALQWVTHRMVPPELSLVFLSTRDRDLKEAIDLLREVLPPNISFCLVNALHGIDFVLRGVLPKEWVRQNLTASRRGARIFRDALELIVNPEERYRWRPLQDTGDGTMCRRFEADDVDMNVLSSPQSRVIYDPSKLPIQSFYVLIRAEERSRPLHDLLLRDRGAPVRDLLRVRNVAYDPGSGFLSATLKGLLGIAVCEFDNFKTNNGGELMFFHNSLQLHGWKQRLLTEVKGVENLWFLPCVILQEGYESLGEEAPAASVSFPTPAVPFAWYVNPAQRAGVPTTPLHLPLADFVILGSPKSGRSVLGAWISAWFAKEEYTVVYACLTDRVDQAGPVRDNGRLAWLLVQLVSRHSRRATTYLLPDDLRGGISGSEKPEAFYTEVSPGTDLERLLLDLAGLARDKKILLFVDEVGEADGVWLRRLVEQDAGRLHIGLIASDMTPDLSAIADRSSVLITNLSRPPSEEDERRSPNVQFVRRLLTGQPADSVQINLQDLYGTEKRHFVMLLRKSEGGKPVRGSIDTFSLQDTPPDPLQWGDRDFYPDYDRREQ